MKNYVKSKKKRKVIVCKGCIYLKEIDESSCCLATSKFKNSPIKHYVDIEGTVRAIDRNIKNNCHLKRLFSLKALQMKLWILINK